MEKIRIWLNQGKSWINNHQKISGSIGIILVLSLFGFFLLKEEKPMPVVEPPKAEVKEEKKVEVASRISFFFTAPLKGSLAMPANWEGKYRLVDSGTTAMFKYIENPNVVNDIFTITYYKKADWEALAEKKGEVILEQEGLVFVYNKNPINPYKDKESDKFLEMQAESEGIIKTFMGFKL